MKMLFLILFPVLQSCSIHWCAHLDIEPQTCPTHQGQIMETCDNYNPGSAGSDGIDVIDLPFLTS